VKYLPDRVRSAATLYCDWVDDTAVIHLLDARVVVQKDMNRLGASVSILGLGLEVTVEVIWSVGGGITLVEDEE